MKFLCDNCKAKYQISDDKVAGKTVRMKCRKCGHQIEVRAAVTETSVSMHPPAASPGAAALKGAPPPKRPGSGLATNLSAAARPQTQKMKAPEQSALAGAFAKSVSEDAPRSVKPSSAPPPPSALEMLDVSMTEEWYVAINGVPVGPVRVSELRRKAASGAVTEDSLCWQEGLEEWRPVKSIPDLARMVREAALSGRPSLTGTSERPSANPPPPAAALPAPSAPSAPSAPAAMPRGMTPRPPTAAPMASPGLGGGAPHPPPQRSPGAPLAPAASRNNVVPISGRLATAEKIEEPMIFTQPAAPPPPMQAPPAPSPLSPFSALAPATSAPLQAPMITEAAATASGGGLQAQSADPFGMQAVAGTGQFGVAGSMPGSPGTLYPSVPPGSMSMQPARRGTPLWAIAAIAFAGCFGIAVAILVFMPKPQQAAAPVVIQVPTPPTAPTTTASDTSPQASASAAASAAASASAARVALSSGPHSTVATASTHTGADLTSLLGGPVSGPNVGPNGPGGPGSGGGLDGNSVQRIVRDRAPAVRRKCWDAGTNDQKSSANVQVAVTVAANGSVQDAQASGDDPTIASCIAREVKGWSFPAPGSQTTVNIPFHFVRQ